MSYYKVVYDKLFPYAPYLNERIGIEILVETSQDPMDALEEARKIVHDFRNKHIQAELSHQYEPTQQESLPPEPAVLPSIQVEEEKPEMSLIRQMATCTDVEVLKSYRLLAKKDPIDQAFYDIKLAELKKTVDATSMGFGMDVSKIKIGIGFYDEAGKPSGGVNQS